RVGRAEALGIGAVVARLHDGAYAFALGDGRALDARPAAPGVAAGKRARDDQLRDPRGVARSESAREIAAHRATGDVHRAGDLQLAHLLRKSEAALVVAQDAERLFQARQRVRVALETAAGLVHQHQRVFSRSGEFIAQARAVRFDP